MRASAVGAPAHQLESSGNHHQRHRAVAIVRALIQEIQDQLINLTGQFAAGLPALAVAAVIAFATRYAARYMQRFITSVARRTVGSHSLQLLISKTSFVTTWVLGLLFAAVIAFPDLRLGDLVALLGFGSVAIGFAFQDIFKNFLAGILLLLQEPFRIGDQIVVESYEGTVEDIALRATQIRTYQGELILIPNSIVFTSPVRVLTEQPHRRTDLAVGFDYNTPLPFAVTTLKEAMGDVAGIFEHPELEIDIVGFGDSSIDFMVRYWTQPQKKVVRRVQTAAIIAIKQACDRASINIPYPIRTVYHFDQDRYDDCYPKAAEKVPE